MSPLLGSDQGLLGHQAHHPAQQQQPQQLQQQQQQQQSKQRNDRIEVSTTTFFPCQGMQKAQMLLCVSAVLQSLVYIKYNQKASKHLNIMGESHHTLLQFYPYRT